MYSCRSFCKSVSPSPPHWVVSACPGGVTGDFCPQESSIKRKKRHTILFIIETWFWLLTNGLVNLDSLYFSYDNLSWVEMPFDSRKIALRPLLANPVLAAVKFRFFTFQHGSINTASIHHLNGTIRQNPKWILGRFSTIYFYHSFIYQSPGSFSFIVPVKLPSCLSVTSSI